MRLLYNWLWAYAIEYMTTVAGMVKEHASGDTEGFARAAEETPQGNEGRTYACALQNQRCTGFASVAGALCTVPMRVALAEVVSVAICWCASV